MYFTKLSENKYILQITTIYLKLTAAPFPAFKGVDCHMILAFTASTLRRHVQWVAI